MNVLFRQISLPQIRQLSTNVIFLQEAFQEKNPHEIVFNEYNNTYTDNRSILDKKFDLHFIRPCRDCECTTLRECKNYLHNIK